MCIYIYIYIYPTEFYTELQFVPTENAVRVHYEEEPVIPQFRQMIGIYCESLREHTRTP